MDKNLLYVYEFIEIYYFFYSKVAIILRLSDTYKNLVYYN